jgi:hypothetical protein
MEELASYIADEMNRNIEGLRAWDDSPDRESIKIAVSLYDVFPNGNVTGSAIMDKILFCRAG